MNVRILEAAYLEIEEASTYYASASPGLEIDFIDELNEFLDLIAHFPRMSTPMGRFYRRLLMRFPYSIIYEIHDDAVVVHGISHHSRGPEHWASRGL